MILEAEFEENLQARVIEIEGLVAAASQAPDAGTLARLQACFDAGAELQERLTRTRNQLSGDLHRVNRIALAENAGQPRMETLELHG